MVRIRFSLINEMKGADSVLFYLSLSVLSSAAIIILRCSVHRRPVLSFIFDSSRGQLQLYVPSPIARSIPLIFISYYRWTRRTCLEGLYWRDQGQELLQVWSGRSYRMSLFFAVYSFAFLFPLPVFPSSDFCISSSPVFISYSYSYLIVSTHLVLARRR